MAIVKYDDNTSNKCLVTPTEITSIKKNTTITITANSGYKFQDKSSPFLSWTDRDGNTRTTNMVSSWFSRTLSEDSKTITLVSLVDFSSNASSITCKQNDTYPIINDTSLNPILTLNKENIENVSFNPSDNQIEINGESQILTVIANNGYSFKDIPYLTYNDTNYYFEKSNNNYIFDLANLNVTTDSTANIYAKATADIIYKVVDIIATNCSVEPIINKVSENDVINITATASNGYIFKVTPQINFNNRDAHIVDFTKVTDYQYVLSVTVSSSDLTLPENHITITATAITETPIIRKYGTIQAYKPTLSNMNDLAKKRFKENGTVDGITYSDIDLGQYITQFKRVFIDIVSNSFDNIYLGRNNTEIISPIIDDDIVIVDCGNIQLIGENQNELDTKIYKIFLSLTCYGVTQIDSIYMNKTINIKYRCNIITGYADIIISYIVDNVLIPIQQLRCKISQDLPYIINGDQLKNNIDDDVYNEPPKIILQKQNIFSDNGYDTFKQDTIKNEANYFTIDRFIEHQINAPKNELDEIENLLKMGVYL